MHTSTQTGKKMYTICNSLPERSETVSLLLFSAGTQAYLLPMLARKKKKKKNLTGMNTFMYIGCKECITSGSNWFSSVQEKHVYLFGPFSEKSCNRIGATCFVTAAAFLAHTIKIGCNFFLKNVSSRRSSRVVMHGFVCVRYEDGDAEDEDEGEG